LVWLRSVRAKRARRNVYCVPIFWLWFVRM
jgi:hypothetical protein